MDKIDKYIDGLYHQEFSGTGAPVLPSGGDWSQLRNVIRKKNFMRFSPGSFNIYYLSFIAAAVTTIGSFLLPGNIGDNKNETLNPPSNFQVIDTLTKTDSLRENADSTLILKLEHTKANCFDKKTEYQLMKDEPAKENSFQPTEGTNPGVNHEIIVESGDSLSKTIEKNYPANGEKINEKQTLNEVVPADTIIKIDTILIQKKGIQFKRKKGVF
jgi:hypothetical protein